MKVITNTPNIGKTRLKLLAQALYRGIKAYYEDEKNIQAFNEWKNKKEKQQNET